MNFLGTEITLPDYIPMTSWLEHGPFAMWLIRKIRPRRIVELGTHHGYSYFAMCQAVKEVNTQTECFAVDTWSGDEHAGFYDESIFEGVIAQNRNYAKFSRLLRKTFVEALSDIEDGSVDLLHVDGRHFYGDVKEDFESWIPKLSASAVVLFHDTEVRDRNFGVFQYWDEIKDSHPSLNFKHCHGLGVLMWGADIPEGLLDFVEMTKDPRQNALIVDFFAAAAGQLTAEHTLADRDAQIDACHTTQVEAEKLISELEQQAKLQSQREADLLEQQTKLLANEAELRAHEASLLAQHAELQARTEDLQSQLANSEYFRKISEEAVQGTLGLRLDLADARRRPFKSFRRKYLSKALYVLAKQESVFSERRRSKFVQSARKRDPKRSLFDLPQSVEIELQAASVGQTETPVLASTGPIVGLKPGLKTVMVVSHDASRTGAPILALNLVRELSTRCNVVTVVLGGGELLADFAALSVDVLQLDRHALSGRDISGRVAKFSTKYGVSEAFVNSVESRSVLPGLQRAGVISVALMHEFASYTRPETAFPEVFTNADQVVFSTRITLANATSERGYETPVNVHVLPQGKCVVPRKAGTEDEQAHEQRWLASVLRPGGEARDEFVIIGAGAIELRKGIDLFIETATRVISSVGGARFRFVWIGEVYGSFNETLKSVHLEDQINRAGIQAQVQIVRSTSEIEYAYATADLMLLSSRLDPLPNVAIDMLLAGKPVLCFDRTTGIADFLRDSGLEEACVAKYLDTSEMAQKICALAENPQFLSDVVTKGSERAREVFNFSSYVDQLESIADLSGIKSERIKQDLQYLLPSGAFRSDFFHNATSSKKSDGALVKKYLEANQGGPFFMKPAPGFNQLVYAEENGWGMSQDPFVHFLKAGRPQGRWSLQVIDDNSPVNTEAVAEPKVALHIHAYFEEELRDIFERLSLNSVRPTVFITARQDIIGAVHKILENYTGPVADVQAVRNAGRDIGPLLTTFGPRLVQDFDIIGHLHTKRSSHVGDRAMVQRWINMLLENTVGGPSGGPMLDRIITAMSEAPDLGIVFPDDPGIVGWTKNRRQAEDLATRMGLGQLPEKIDFPVGTMFWARSAVLKKFVDMNLGWEDYPAEPLPIDGSMLHAIERMFGVVPAEIGMQTGVTNVHGLTR